MKPIIFSTPMVKAILESRKTQTRRVIKINGYPITSPEESLELTKEGLIYHSFCSMSGYYKLLCQPGDILWVREKWRTVDYEYCDGKWSASIEYADGIRGPRVFYYDNSDVGIPVDSIYSQTGWHSPMFMPREAARIFLRVTNVRVERVQEITVDDCRLEGCCCSDCLQTGPHSPDCKCDTLFYNTWNDINAKRGYGWETNPWVWVIEFERINKE